MFKKKATTKDPKAEEAAGGDAPAAEGGEAKKEEQTKDQEAGGVGAMKSGDYMIHVFIEKIKEINIPKDQSTVNPMVQVECLGQKTFSTAKKDIGSLGETIFNEHLFLEPKQIEKTDAEGGKITIKLMEKGILKDKMIGQFDLDMSFIYLKKDHVLMHKWLALSNPNGEDYSKIQAYMKVSVAVTCQGDEMCQIEQDTAAQEDTEVMMSPALNPKFFQIKCRLFCGQDLPMMDSGIGFLSKDKIDAYMLCNFKGKKYKTKTIIQEKNGPAVHWNTEFWLPAQLPVLAPKIQIRLMDEDDIGSDEVAGTLQFKTQEIIESSIAGKNKGFMWKNIYGSPLGQSNSEAKRLMNENPEFASQWKGRVLMSIVAEPTDKPLAKTISIDQELINQAAVHAQNKEYAIIAQIGQAVCLPSTKKYDIKITIGGHEMIFKPFEQKTPGTHKRYNRIDQQQVFLPYVDILDFGSVIVQLMDGSDPVCFYKDEVSNFLDKDPKMQWYSFVPDKSVGKVKHPYEVGQFSMRLSIHNTSKDGPIEFSKFKNWSKKVPMRANPIKIRAYIYQCRDLPAADSEGTSDPYITVWDITATEKKKKKTKIVEDNCNPLYYQTLELDYEVADEKDLESYPPFIFDIFDHDADLFDSTDDFLCRAIVEPEDCSILLQDQFEKCPTHKQLECQLCANLNLEIPSKPQWHKCYFMPGQPQCGEILVSFSVTKDEYKYNKPCEQVDLSSLVPTREFNVKMLILGLRDLQSPGILPVKKAFVKFNINSLVPPNGPAIKNIQTQPTAPGPNPTLNTTMKFMIPLPIEELYCPRLSCSVYDYIFKGWNQPLIGVFTLPIGELMIELMKERKEETEAIEEIQKELDKILNSDIIVPRYSIKPAEDGLRGTALNDSQGFDRSYSEYSDANDDTEKKLISKKRKKGKKSLIKDENSESYVEALEGNEQVGITKALLAQQSQLERIQERKKSITNQFDNAQYSNFSQIQGNGSEIKKAPTLKINELESEYKQLSSIEQRIQNDERLRAQEELIRKKGNDAFATIVWPKYKLDPRLKVYKEFDVPPKNLYMSLGWDETHEQKRKHYRRFFNDELEKDDNIFPPKPYQKESTSKSPFNCYELKKGQTRGNSTGMFQSAKKDASGQTSTEQVVGYFKAVVEVENPQDYDAYQAKKLVLINKLKDQISKLSMKILNKPFLLNEQNLSDPTEREMFENKLRELGAEHLNISKALTNLNSDEILKAALLKTEKCVIRFYAVKGENMASRDNGSPSDTYLRLECNGKVYNEREIYQLDEPNPKFYKMYDFEGLFPGSSPLKIQVWDYDAIFGDELIGTSMLDLEDRYFTLDWVALKDKPIEKRDLSHPSSNNPQGQVYCWVEITPVNMKPDNKPPTWEITAKPEIDLQVRVCILNCVDIPVGGEGIIDAYFRCFFDTSEDVQETDTHFRCSDGKPDFQYRLVFDIKYPREITKLSLQCYDKDFFKSNDLVGFGEIDLQQLMDDVSHVKKNLTYNKNWFDQVMNDKPIDERPNIEWDKENANKFYLRLFSKKDGKTESAGKVGIQIDIFPKDMADKNPVAKARGTPNHSPMLPNPEGRLEFSLNPFKMLSQLISPALYRKIKIYLCVAICCALFIAILPNILGTLISNAIVGII